MAELLKAKPALERLNQPTVAIGGDYLTEDQAAALGRFLASLHRRELRREQNKPRPESQAEGR